MNVLVALALVETLADVKTVDASTPEPVQIALLESAAPAAVVRDAAMFVIGRDGYRQIRDGKNGFTCLISRQYRNTVEPECFDAEGTSTTVPVRMFVEAQRASGASDAAIEKAVADGYASGRFKAPRKPGLVYMLSPNNYVFDPLRKAIVRFPGHLMFYAPYATEKEVGSGPGAPFIVSPGTPQALLIVVPAGSGEHR